MYLSNIIVGQWNDPHMLAGFMATFCAAVGSDSTSSMHYEASRTSDAWARYAMTSYPDGKPISLVTLAGDNRGGFDELAEAVLKWQHRTDELQARFKAWDRDGRPMLHAVCRQPILTTERMFASAWGNPNVWHSTNMLWLGRTWRYADIVAPWRPVTEDAIKKPRKYCRPIPSPVPVDVKAAIDACLLAGEPAAAMSYYQSWRNVQAQEVPCER